jgi:hypothetical protein
MNSRTSVAVKIALVMAAFIVLISALFGDGRGNDRSRHSDVLVVTQDSHLALEVRDKHPVCLFVYKKQ